MKKLFAILLAVTMLASVATVASAANTTTLTTTVPAATYTLNIPADQEIPFGATLTDIGEISVTEATGFARGKNLQVTLTYSDFVCEGVSTTIPYIVKVGGTIGTTSGKTQEVMSGSSIFFEGKVDGSTEKYSIVKTDIEADCTYIEIASEDWGKALAGEYTATITFTAEVVAEQ